MPRGRKNKSLDERIQDTQQSIYNLEVRIKAGNLQQLLQCLRRLCQCIKLSRVHT